MSFLDNKEDILEFFLTDYGRVSLANGVFKPYFYSFSDKDIIYNHDNVYTGTLVGNNGRISNTPRVISPLNESCILGNSQPSNDLKTSFSVKCINGIVSGSISFETSNDASEYIYTINMEAYDKFDYDIDSMVNDSSILLEIVEENSLFRKENFDIEIFKIENNEEKELRFISREIFKDFAGAAFFSEDLEISLIEEMPMVNNKTVEYFLKVTTDKQILVDYAYENDIDIDTIEDRIEEEIVNC